MSQHATARTADPGAAVCHYQRHRPEQSLLYRLIEQYYPALVEHLAAQDRSFPESVQQEFEAFLKCRRLEHGVLRVRCERCHSETLVAFRWPLRRILRSRQF